MAQQGKKENILILGATGYIGTHITDKIVESKSSFGRIAIFTSPSTIEKKAGVIDRLKAEGAEVIVGDATNADDIVKALKDIDTIVSAVGRGFIDGQINWIKLAGKVPTVKRFFPSEYGTDIEYSPESANEKPHQQKLKVRAALKEAKYLDHTYVVTGPYAEAVLRSTPIPGSGSYNVKEKKAILYGAGTGKISLTTKDDVGRLTVKALLHPEASKNRALKVNSFTTTEQEALAEFEKQTGGQKWRVEYISIEDLKKFEKEAWESGNPVATLFTLRRIWATGGTLYEKRDNYLIDGDDTDTLQDAVRSAIASQVGEKSSL